MIYLLISVSLAVAILFLLGFFWAVFNGQYEDDYSPSVRILFDDQPNKTEPKVEKSKRND